MECVLCSGDLGPGSVRVIYSPCGHSDVCVECALRQSRLVRSSLCPLCKTSVTEMIATCTHLESREAIQQLVGRDASMETDLVRRMGRDRWGMRIDSVLAGSDSRRILEEIERVRAFVCPYSLDSSPVACRGDRCTVREEEQSMGACTSDSGGVVFRSMADLKRHVRSKHNMMYCDICIRGKYSFVKDQCVYSRTQLEKHCETGWEPIGPGLGYGHPLCPFCRTRYFDPAQFLGHLRERHSICTVCERMGFPGRFFSDDQALSDHYRRCHFLCPEIECVQAQHVVFSSDIEVYAHMKRCHRGNPYIVPEYENLLFQGRPLPWLLYPIKSVEQETNCYKFEDLIASYSSASSSSSSSSSSLPGSDHLSASEARLLESLRLDVIRRSTHHDAQFGQIDVIPPRGIYAKGNEDLQSLLQASFLGRHDRLRQLKSISGRYRKGQVTVSEFFRVYQSLLPEHDDKLHIWRAMSDVLPNDSLREEMIRFSIDWSRGGSISVQPSPNPQKSLLQSLLEEDDEEEKGRMERNIRSLGEEGRENHPSLRSFSRTSTSSFSDLTSSSASRFPPPQPPPLPSSSSSSNRIIQSSESMGRLSGLENSKKTIRDRIHERSNENFDVKSDSVEDAFPSLVSSVSSIPVVQWRPDSKNAFRDKIAGLSPHDPSVDRSAVASSGTNGKQDYVDADDDSSFPSLPERKVASSSSRSRRPQRSRRGKKASISSSFSLNPNPPKAWDPTSGSFDPPFSSDHRPAVSLERRRPRK